jgi:hypothetical protein
LSLRVENIYPWILLPILKRWRLVHRGCCLLSEVRSELPPPPLALAKSLTLLALAGTLALAPLSACGTSALVSLGASTFG